jgi:hypothetical protein
LAAWLSGFLVVATTRFILFNITPDTILAYQLACLGGLLAFHLARDRQLSRSGLIAAGAAILLPAYVRGEGGLVAAATLPLLPLTVRPFREAARRGLWISLGMALLALPSALRNLAVFGRLVPAPRALRLWITTYGDLYAFQSDPTPARFWAQGWARLVEQRTEVVAAHLEVLTVQVPWPLLVLAVIGTLAHCYVFRARGLVLPAFLLLTLFGPTLVAPLLSSRLRFVLGALPVLCVLAVRGAVALCDLARRLVDRGAVDVVVLGGSLAASIFVFQPGTTRETHLGALRWNREVPATIRAARSLHLQPDDTVLTDDPWRVAADLDVVTVMCPWDGVDAANAVAEKYRPRYLVTTRTSDTLRELQSSGRFRLRQVAQLEDATWFEFTW